MGALRIACVQMHAREAENFGTTAEEILSLMDDAARTGADLIVFPEASYPAYYVGPGRERAKALVAGAPKFLESVSRKARALGVYAAVGALFPEEDGTISNSAFLYDSSGALLLHVRKSNMWHFDSRYVRRGRDYSVTRTPLGSIAMMVCADGRAPEIPRILALKGADVILDLANLTTSGKRRETLSNPQIDYMLPSRARENTVWLVVADKVGLEAKSVLNCGSSRIIDPWGKTVASLNPFEESIVYASVDLSLPRPELPKRFPERYALISAAKRRASPSGFSADREIFCGVIQFSFDTLEAYVGKAASFLETAQDQGYSVICLPPLHDGLSLSDAEERVRPHIRTGRMIVLGGPGASGTREIVFLSADGAEVRCAGRGAIRAYDTSCLRIGTMTDGEGFTPEVARCLMADGVEVVFWYDWGHDPAAEMIARTRAAENKVYVIRCASVSNADASCIVAPTGVIAASALPGEDQISGAMLTPFLTSLKTVVPGTNVYEDRFPEDYEYLVSQEHGHTK